MIMSNMTATQHLEIIREKNRPTVNDYIPAIFNHFTELHGDRHYGDDAAILSGIATLNSTPVTVIAQVKGRNIEENKKMLAAMKHGFTGLLCIGETKEEKGYGIADEVLRTQIKVGLHGIAAEDLDKVWIAYEPVWAIGVNGIPAPVEYAQEKHHVIRETLRELYGEAADVVPALYGGSVNLENATRLFVQPDIDGLYVGRVAWDAKRFAGLIADCLATGEK